MLETKKRKLNIGCGRDYKIGWINIEISRKTKADVYLDIRKESLPEETGSCDEIYISGVLEQIGLNEEFIFVLNECNRVLKPSGLMTVIVPNSKYSVAHQDPMDVRKFTPATFSYFDKREKHYELYGKLYGFLPWSLIKISENENHILIVKMYK